MKPAPAVATVGRVTVHTTPKPTPNRETQVVVVGGRVVILTRRSRPLLQAAAPAPAYRRPAVA